VRLHQSSSFNRRNDSDKDDDDDDDDDDAPPNIRSTPQEFLRKMQQRRENGGDEINVFSRDDNKSLQPTSPNSNKSSPFASGKFNFDNSGIGNSIKSNIAIGPKKDRTIYTCTNCNAEHSQWVGKCPSCQAWNTVEERRRQSSSSSGNRFKLPFATSTITTASSLSWLDGISTTGSSTGPVRVTDIYQEMIDSSSSSSDGKSSSITSYEQIKIHRTQIPNDVELTNVLGGGIMPGSITLVGGDPGVGKSTLMLQMAGSVASLSVRSSIYQGIGMGPPIPSPTITANDGDQKKREDSTNNNSNATGNKRGQRQGGGIGPVLYISGEENAGQIASRALRLGIHDPELLLWCETDADVIAETVATAVSSYNIDNNDYYYNDDDDDDSVMSTASGPSMTRPPSLVVIDSIQTMICQSAGSSSVGGITQVKECVTLFLRLAKSTGVPIMLVGHVTKNGDVAGPRTVEHMVDCVLYLEGGSLLGSGSGGGSSSSTEGGGAGSGLSSLRVLRAAKNRFGSSDEVGVYEMSRDNGRLVPISDPSSFFLSTRQDSVDAEGCAISVALEGIRSMTVEVQALVPWSADRGAGRRIVDGISYSRLLLILAVLQKRYGISFHRRDVYVNVAGGMHLGSRGGSKSGSAGGGGSDLAVAVSVVSSLLGIPIRSDTAFVGEIGLLGELRPVHSLEKRIAEARRMGFARIVTPSSPNSWGGGKKNRSKDNSPGPREISAGGITQLMCQNVLDAINCGLVVPLPTRRTGNGPALIKPKPIKVNNSSWDRGSNDDDRHERDIIIDDEDDIDGIIFE
jgi:DNA repair protein RadA/Sms